MTIHAASLVRLSPYQTILELQKQGYLLREIAKMTEFGFEHVCEIVLRELEK